MIKGYLYKKLLPKIMEKEFEETISGSDSEGQRTDTYLLFLDKNGSTYFIANEYKDEILNGLKWDGNKFNIKHSINIKELESLEFRLVHFIGTKDVKYRSIYLFGLSYLIRFSYFIIWINKNSNSFAQFLFNKKKLVTKERMELLQTVIEYQLNNHSAGISIMNLMTELYSLRWIFHPAQDYQEDKLKLYLDSFIDSGELKHYQSKYQATGKAIKTITIYEEEKRRHTSSFRLKLLAAFLTILLSSVGLVQSGHIKLPVLVDFTEDESKIDDSDNSKLRDSSNVNITVKQVISLQPDSLNQK